MTSLLTHRETTELHSFLLADCATSWMVRHRKVSQVELLAMASHAIHHLAPGTRQLSCCLGRVVESFIQLICLFKSTGNHRDRAIRLFRKGQLASHLPLTQAHVSLAGAETRKEVLSEGQCPASTSEGSSGKNSNSARQDLALAGKPDPLSELLEFPLKAS